MGEGTHSGVESLHVAFDNEAPSVFLGIPVTELEHLLEFPLGVDVHKGEGGTSGGKSLFGQTDHDGRVLTDAVEHHGVFKLCCNFADDVYGFCLKFFEVTQRVIF